MLVSVNVDGSSSVVCVCFVELISWCVEVGVVVVVVGSVAVDVVGDGV